MIVHPKESVATYERRMAVEPTPDRAANLRR